MTIEQAGEIVKLILAAFPAQRVKFTPEMILDMRNSYHALLDDLELDHARAATVRALKAATYMPSAGEIRKACVENLAGPRKTGSEAWGEVNEMVARYGWANWPGVLKATTKDGEPLDGLTVKVIRELTWHTLTHGDTIPNRARFIDAYESASKGEREQAQIAPGASVQSLRLAAGSTLATAKRIGQARGIAALIPDVTSDEAIREAFPGVAPRGSE